MEECVHEGSSMTRLQIRNAVNVGPADSDHNCLLESPLLRWIAAENYAEASMHFNSRDRLMRGPPVLLANRLYAEPGCHSGHLS